MVWKTAPTTTRERARHAFWYFGRANSNAEPPHACRSPLVTASQYSFPKAVIDVGTQQFQGSMNDLRDNTSVNLVNITGNALVPIAAFLSGWASTLLLYRVATRGGRTSVATMLLAGALSGVLVYMADDDQLRDLTFWGLGSLAGATWAKALIAAPLILLSLGVSR